MVAWCRRPQSHRHSHTRRPPCRWGKAPLHHQAVEALPGEVVALGCLGLVPGLGHLPAKAAAALGDPPAQAGAPGGDPSPALAGARYQASRPVTPAGAGTCSTTVSRPKVFPTMGTLALVTPSPLSSMGKPQYR